MKQSTENNMATIKKPFYKTFWGAIVSIIAICITLYFVFFASLAQITGHGEELKVPELQGKLVTDVYADLEAQGFAIVIDSTYDPNKPGLTIMDQQPLPGNTVKPGRHIFITLNKTVPPNSSMPNLVNLSLRSALLMLKTHKLLLGDTTTAEDMPAGAVAEQLFNGSPIAAGTQIPQGSKVDLKIGAGYKAAKVAVPDVFGLTYQVATSIISASNLKFDIIWEGEITDSANAVVTYQLPNAFNEDNEAVYTDQGSTIDIKVSQTQK